VLDERLEDLVDPAAEDRLALDLREADRERPARNKFLSKLEGGTNRSTVTHRTGVERRLCQCHPDRVFEARACALQHASFNDVIQERLGGRTPLLSRDSA
jgi:hypothetical protein